VSALVTKTVVPIGKSDTALVVYSSTRFMHNTVNYYANDKFTIASCTMGSVPHINIDSVHNLTPHGATSSFGSEPIKRISQWQLASYRQ